MFFLILGDIFILITNYQTKIHNDEKKIIILYNFDTAPKNASITYVSQLDILIIMDLFFLIIFDLLLN